MIVLWVTPGTSNRKEIEVSEGQVPRKAQASNDNIIQWLNFTEKMLHFKSLLTKENAFASQANDGMPWR